MSDIEKTKKSFQEKMKEVDKGIISQREFLEYCVKNEAELLDSTKSGVERRLIKSSLFMAKKIFRIKGDSK